MLLHHLSPNVPHFGRTIVHHAVLCGNSRALEVLLNCGADIEFHNQTSQHTDVRPVHLASRLGLATILGLLIELNIDEKDENESQLLWLLLLWARAKWGFCEEAHKEGQRGASYKDVEMVEVAGVLHWGKSSKRNVIYREAEVGPSCVFRWNRRRKSDVDDAGVFRVVTTKNKEIHFSCSEGLKTANLWVMGIRFLNREAMFGRNVQ
ncbi:hypothetical protein ACS0TY_009656 [Phlomoides rotata]